MVVLNISTKVKGNGKLNFILFDKDGKRSGYTTGWQRMEHYQFLSAGEAESSDAETPYLYTLQVSLMGAQKNGRYEGG